MALFFIAVIFCGCSGKQPLSGKVTFSDGSPLTIGTVCFTDGANLSRGIIKADGSYAVETLGKKDGIPKGEYRVYITGTETLSKFHDKRGREIEIGKSAIASKYASDTTSDLTFKADGKTFKYDIQVERP